MAKSRFLTGLTAQALLLSLLLLIVPGGFIWLTQNHVNRQAELETDTFQQFTNLLGAALVHAPAARTELTKFLDMPDAAVFVHQLPGYIEIDGQARDWAILVDAALHYGTMHTLEVRQPYSEDSSSFDLLAATDQVDLFVLVTVTDEQVVYRDINNISVHRNDHLQIAVIDQDGQYQRYTIAPLQPGPADAFEVSPVATGSRAQRTNEKIEAYWQATGNGYQVEIRLPLDALTLPSFALTVNDVDDPAERSLGSIVGTAATSYPEELGRLAMPATNIRALLQTLLPTGYGAEVTNLDGQLIASAGIPDGSAQLWAEAPIVTEEKKLGTLVVRADSSIRVQPLDYVIAAILFCVASLVLLMFALMIRLRLLGLERRIRGAVDNRGRVQQVKPGMTAPDEIGDLNCAFDRVSERLQQYTRYLESLSGRLAHELRTPVTVIRTSLDNLPADTAEAVYIDRARQGVERLTTILNQMTEASRLEEALNPADAQYFDLARLVTALVDSYAAAFPAAALELDIDATLDPIDGLPDLLAQMLDKLVNNAIEFATPGTLIRIRLTREDDQAVLRVINTGPELPPGLSEELFDSMVSVRSSGDGTHLGLGLYIAKLVAEFHGGTITAANREDVSGVIVTVRLPLLRIVSRR